MKIVFLSEGIPDFCRTVVTLKIGATLSVSLIDAKEFVDSVDHDDQVLHVQHRGDAKAFFKQMIDLGVLLGGLYEDDADLEAEEDACLERVSPRQNAESWF